MLLQEQTESVRGAVASRWRRARSQPRRSWIAWTVVFAVLVIGPIAFTLARSDTFTATVDVRTVSVPPFGEPRLPEYAESLLRKPHFRRGVLNSPSIEVDDPLSDVEIRPIANVPEHVSLRGSFDNPGKARRLTDVIAAHFFDTAVQDLRQRADSRLAELRRRRRRLQRSIANGGSARLAPITGEIRQLEDLTNGTPRAQIDLGPRARRPHLTRVADKAVDAFPGSFPTRPNPVAAGAAGLAAAIALLSLSGLLRRRRSGTAAD